VEGQRSSSLVGDCRRVVGKRRGNRCARAE